MGYKTGSRSNLKKMPKKILEKSPKNLYAKFQLERPNFRGTFTSAIV